jgi:hypothetical protein
MIDKYIVALIGSRGRTGGRGGRRSSRSIVVIVAGYLVGHWNLDLDELIHRNIKIGIITTKR